MFRDELLVNDWMGQTKAFQRFEKPLLSCSVPFVPFDHGKAPHFFEAKVEGLRGRRNGNTFPKCPLLAPKAAIRNEYYPEFAKVEQPAGRVGVVAAGAVKDPGA